MVDCNNKVSIPGSFPIVIKGINMNPNKSHTPPQADKTTLNPHTLANILNNKSVSCRPWTKPSFNNHMEKTYHRMTRSSLSRATKCCEPMKNKSQSCTRDPRTKHHENNNLQHLADNLMVTNTLPNSFCLAFSPTVKMTHPRKVFNLSHFLELL